MEQDISYLRKGFTLKANSSKVVICLHGFGGSPAEHYLTGLALQKAGYNVVAPLIAGHGTTMEDFDKSKWKEWCQSAEDCYQEVKKEYSSIYVLGLSNGGLLALYLASNHPEVKALSLMAPALVYKSKLNYLAPLIAPFKKHIPFVGDTKFPGGAEKYLHLGYGESSVPACYQMTLLQHQVKKRMPAMKIPYILFYSHADQLVDYKMSEKIILKKMKEPAHKVVNYESSSHVMSLDKDRDSVFFETINFFGNY